MTIEITTVKALEQIQNELRQKAQLEKQNEALISKGREDECRISNLYSQIADLKEHLKAKQEDIILIDALTAKVEELQKENAELNKSKIVNQRRLMTKSELSALTQVKILANDILDKKELVGIGDYGIKDLILDTEITIGEIIAEMELCKERENYPEIVMLLAELKSEIDYPTTPKELNNRIDNTFCRMLEIIG